MTSSVKEAPAKSAEAMAVAPRTAANANRDIVVLFLIGVSSSAAISSSSPARRSAVRTKCKTH